MQFAGGRAEVRHRRRRFNVFVLADDSSAVLWADATRPELQTYWNRLAARPASFCNQRSYPAANSVMFAVVVTNFWLGCRSAPNARQSAHRAILFVPLYPRVQCAKDVVFIETTSFAP